MCLCQVPLIQSRVWTCIFQAQFSLHYKQSCFSSLFAQPQRAFPAGKSGATLMFTGTIFHFKSIQLFCCQCSSVAPLLDLISKQNGTILPSTDLKTPTPSRAVLTPDVIPSGDVVFSASWGMVKYDCRKYSVSIQRYKLMSCTMVVDNIMFMRRFFPAV